MNMKEPELNTQVPVSFRRNRVSTYVPPLKSKTQASWNRRFPRLLYTRPRQANEGEYVGYCEITLEFCMQVSLFLLAIFHVSCLPLRHLTSDVPGMHGS